jgi:hypothetical protein
MRTAITRIQGPLVPGYAKPWWEPPLGYMIVVDRMSKPKKGFR